MTNTIKEMINSFTRNFVELAKELCPKDKYEKIIFLIFLCLGIALSFIASDLRLLPYSPFLEYDQYEYFQPLTNPSYLAVYKTRHPLFSVIFFPFTCLNFILGILFSCKIKFFATTLLMNLIFALTNLILFKYLRKILSLTLFNSFLLCLFYSSFGHVIVLSTMPESFQISTFLLIFSLYLITKKYLDNQDFSGIKYGILFVLTTGITLTNGVKIALFYFILSLSNLKTKLKIIIISSISFCSLCALLYLSSCTLYIIMDRDRAPAKITIFEKEKEPLSFSYKEILINTLAEPILFRNFENFVEKESFFIESRKPKDPLLLEHSYKTIKEKILFFLIPPKGIVLDFSTSLFDSCYIDSPDPTYVPKNYVINNLGKSIIAIIYTLVLISTGLFIYNILKRKNDNIIFLPLFIPFSAGIFLHIICKFGITQTYIYSLHWLWSFVLIISLLFKYLKYDFLKILLSLFLSMATIYLFIHNFEFLTNIYLMLIEEMKMLDN